MTPVSRHRRTAAWPWEQDGGEDTCCKSLWINDCILLVNVTATKREEIFVM